MIGFNAKEGGGPHERGKPGTPEMSLQFVRRAIIARHFSTSDYGVFNLP